MQIRSNWQTKGSVRVVKRYRDSDRTDVVFDDNNLIVGLGRRVMSRLIASSVSPRPVATGTAPAIEVVRAKPVGMVAAYVAITPVVNSSNLELRLYEDTGSGPAVVSDSLQVLVPGATTIAQVVSQINASTGWRAVAISGMSSRDAATLLTVTEAPALGTLTSYGTDLSVQQSTSKRTLYAIYSQTVSSPTDPGDLRIDRFRWGTGGHVVGSPTLAKSVLFSDERLVSGLRPIDYNPTAVDPNLDSLPVTVTFANTGIVTFTSTLTVDAANGLKVSEAGLYTPRFMVAKKNFGQITKTDEFSLIAEWSLVF